MQKFVVAYAKIITDKHNISLDGVFYGGMGDTLEEANALAKGCVNTIRGGTILPKIIETNGKEQLLEAMFDATDKFEEVTRHMIDTNEIILRTQKRK